MRYILFVVLFCCSCSKKDLSFALEEVRSQFYKEIAKEYGVHMLEERTTGKGNLQRIAIDYAVYEEGDVLHARLLIHRVAETLLAKMVAVQKEYRSKEKLSEKDMEITISFVDPEAKRKHPFIGVTHVSLLGGWIHYTRYQPNTGEVELMHREEFTTLLAPHLEI